MKKDSYTMDLPFTIPVSEETDFAVARGIVIKKDVTNYRVFIGGAKAFECAEGDYYYKKLVIAVLTDLGCEKMSIARALGVHRNTVTNIESSAREFGMEGLIDGRDGRPGPRKMTPAVVKKVASYYRKGLSASEIYRRLQGKIDPSITLRTIQSFVADMKKQEQCPPLSEKKSAVAGDVSKTEQLQLFDDREVCHETASENDGDSHENTSAPGDQENVPEEESLQEALLSSLPGQENTESDEHTDQLPESSSRSIDEAVDKKAAAASPPFHPEAGRGLSYVGAYLAWPYLSLMGVLPLAYELYGSLMSGTRMAYGLLQSMASFFFLTLLGFTTLESFKVVDRDGFRRLIGNSAAPTVKTLRNKLGILAAVGKGFEFLKGLALRYCALGMIEDGVLYADGHFIPYFGKRFMGKGYFTQRRLAHPGRTQHFINDRQGRPLFFLLREGNEKFSALMPQLIEETHTLVGSHQITFIFDRGASCGPLLKRIEDGGDLFITYKKGMSRAIPGGAFRPLTIVSNRWGKKFEKTYDVWDGEMEVTGYGNARLILVKKKKGHPTPIITNDKTRPVEEVVELMFNRWSQENFFKYMASNFSLDELVTQEVQDAPSPMVTNPRWKELERKRANTKRQIKELECEIGQMASSGESRTYSEDGRKDPFVIKVATLKRMNIMLKKLTAQKKECPEKISLSELTKAAHEVIPTEGKLILDAMKLCAYNAEEWLLELMEKHYHDWRDPRTIVRMIVSQKGDIEVRGDRVIIRLARFSPATYQKAANGLCEELNALEPRSWDGRWRFVYEVAE
jgi:transposase